MKQISTKPSKVKGSDEVKARKSKCEVIEEAKQADIDDKTGIEKIFSNNYFGRAFVSIDNLSVSKEVFTQINQFKILVSVVIDLNRYNKKFLALSAKVHIMKLFHHQCQIEANILLYKVLVCKNTRLLSLYTDLDVDPMCRTLCFMEPRSVALGMPLPAGVPVQLCLHTHE